MADDNNNTAKRFVKLAREMIQRIKEERYHEWWSSTAPLSVEFERMRRELYPQFDWPAFLLVLRHGEFLSPVIPREWISDPGVASSLFDRSDYTGDEGSLLMTDPVSGTTHFEPLDVSSVIDPDYRDCGGFEPFDVHTVRTAILCLRRWIRAVRQGTVTHATCDIPCISLKRSPSDPVLVMPSSVLI